jgi:RimJ/RimL family protein N-acetyltransferase
VREALLRRAALVDGQPVDQEMWSILRDDWRRAALTA